MKTLIIGLGFTRVGQIVLSCEKLRVTLDADFDTGGRRSRNRGWVYLWVKVAPETEAFDIVYVGKAGNTLKTRFAQHQQGFTTSISGKRKAEKLREILTSEPRDQAIHIYARESRFETVLGEPGVCMCESEERAMISMCVRRRIPIWNLQLPASAADLEHQQEHPQTPPSQDQSLEAIPGEVPFPAVDNDEVVLDPMEPAQGMTREDAFFSMLTGNPEAEAVVTELLDRLADLPHVSFYYTFTNGADLRIACTNGAGKRRVVARVWWQPTLTRFGTQQFVDPVRCAQLGATGTRAPYAGTPQHLKALAYFDIPMAAEALIGTLLASIEAYGAENLPD